MKAPLTTSGSITTLGLRARGEGVAKGMQRGWLQAEDAWMELWPWGNRQATLQHPTQQEGMEEITTLPHSPPTLLTMAGPTIG